MKKFVYMILFVFLSGILFGCGGEYAGRTGEKEAASGTAVSGAAVVSGHSVKYTYANDRNLYTEGVDAVEQRSLTGELIRSWEMENFHELFYVDNEYLYYIGWDEKDSQAKPICCIPLCEGEDGNDVLLTKKEQKLSGDSFVESESNHYADSRYLLWIDDSLDGFVKYDRKTNKKQIRKCECGYFAVVSGKIIANFDGILYSQEFESDKWKKIGKCYDPCAWNDKCFFYCSDDGYMMYDVQNEENVLLISEDMTQRTAKEVNVDEAKMSFSFTSYDALFCFDDKLYIQIRYSLKEEYGWRGALYSVDLTKSPLKAHYERDMSDEIFEGCYDSSCLGIVNGKLFYFWNTDEEVYGYYDLAAKNEHVFEGEEDPAYYEMQSDCGIDRYW